jgi:hypothetical protein
MATSRGKINCEHRYVLFVDTKNNDRQLLMECFRNIRMFGRLVLLCGRLRRVNVRLLLLHLAPLPSLFAKVCHCVCCCCNHLFIILNVGTRLEKCEGMPRRLWTLMNDCWQVEPNDRPDAAALLSRLASLLADEGRQ